MRGVFQSGVQNLVRIAAPLNSKTAKESAKNTWISQQRGDDVQNLQNYALISPPALSLTNSTKHMTLETDTCDDQVECVLLQVQHDNIERPIECWSHSLTDAKLKYDNTQRECLTIIWAFLLSRPYLEDTRFTIRKNKDSLKWILSLTRSAGRLAR